MSRNCRKLSLQRNVDCQLIHRKAIYYKAIFVSVNYIYLAITNTTLKES